MKLTSAFMLGCLFCCASTIFADGPGTRASNTYSAPVRVAQVPSPDPAESMQIDAQAEIESMAPAIQAVPGVGDLSCASAQVVFGHNRCPRPTMNQYTSPPFSYQIWAGYPAQKAREEMLRDQLLFSPCPGGFCCRKPLSGACANAHCINGLSGGANGCATGACGSTGYGMAGCALGTCGSKGCGIGHGSLGHGSLGHGLRAHGTECNSCDAPCDASAKAASQAPVLPMAAFQNNIELK